MATHYDEQLAHVTDEAAEAANIVFPHHVGSLVGRMKRMASSNPAERALQHTNMLAVTAGRVLIFPVRLTRASGMTLEAAILDWPRDEVLVSGQRKCHLGTGDAEGKYAGDYVLLALARNEEQLSIELQREGSQRMLRSLSAELTGKW